MNKELKRIFIGVELPDNLKAFLARLYDHGIAAIRWNRRVDLHLTIGFVGELEFAAVQRLSEELATLSAEPFEIGMGEFRISSGSDSPDVDWVGYDLNDEALLSLQAKVDEAIVRAGIEYQPGEFVPRIILGRYAGRADSTSATLIEANQRKVAPKIQVRRIVLFENQPESRGPRYHPLKHYRLKG